MTLEISRLGLAGESRLPVKRLRALLRTTVRRFARRPSFDNLSLVLVTDERIRATNRIYRHQDKRTDVLSFDYGEIMISYPTAKRQAKVHGVSVADEISLLFVHGLLHILGFDHVKPRHRKRMIAAETVILGFSGLVARADQKKNFDKKR